MSSKSAKKMVREIIDLSPETAAKVKHVMKARGLVFPRDLFVLLDEVVTPNGKPSPKKKDNGKKGKGKPSNKGNYDPICAAKRAVVKADMVDKLPGVKVCGKEKSVNSALAEHDRRFHANGINPGEPCRFRETLANGDQKKCAKRCCSKKVTDVANKDKSRVRCAKVKLRK